MNSPFKCPIIPKIIARVFVFGDDLSFDHDPSLFRSSDPLDNEIPEVPEKMVLFACLAVGFPFSMPTMVCLAI